MRLKVYGAQDILAYSIKHKENDVYMKRLLVYSKDYWGQIAIAAISSVTASIATVFIIDILRQIIECISIGNLMQEVQNIILKMLIVICVGIASNYMVVAMTGFAGSGLLKKLRNDAVDSLMKASPEYINQCNYGDLMERITEDIEGLAGFMSGYFKDCMYVPILTVVYIQGFYPVENEKITIGGKDINEYELDELRNIIAYVPQDSYLFEGTIAENIAFGWNGENVPSMDMIIAAAKEAYADKFIEHLPDGYNTKVTAGGTNLSGGQRQRIAIARAFMKNSPIVLMDEPSSALDTYSENVLLKAMKELLENKTVIMVSHRMTGMDKFERVVRIG